jgi:hypothetical protein
MEEIFERLNAVFVDTHAIYVDQETDFSCMKEQIFKLMQGKLNVAEPDGYLTKLEVHLLRLFNPEFLQISVNQLLDS